MCLSLGQLKNIILLVMKLIVFKKIYTVVIVYYKSNVTVLFVVCVHLNCHSVRPEAESFL